MATIFFSSSLPSTSFLRQNPNPNSPYLLSKFSPISVSISHNNNNKFSRKSTTLHVSSAATTLGFPVATTSRSGPDVSDKDTPLDISTLDISQEIVSALALRGITQLFPIQRAVLDPAMEGRDMIGRAITGSGKTLAFGIPILDKIIRNRGSSRQRRIPSALVLAPTRELARQVQKEFKDSAPSLNSVCLYGGMPIMNQARALKFGVDIVVGTPGRVIDLVERGALNLSEVTFVVLDEADQMLAVGFQEDVERILGYLPAKKQCMLFSATMPSWVNQLSKKYLKNPLVVDLVGESEQKLADGISLFSVVSTSFGKENVLSSLISKYGQEGKSIIFTRTKKDAEELSRSIGGSLATRALHGNMQQFQRDKTLAAFRDGRFNVLVATDVAARGLDIPNVDLVIHFEIPNTSEIFVHRSGRTGRAGKKGTAVLIYTKAQRRAVSDIERDLGFRFQELPRIADGDRMEKVGAEESSYRRSSEPRVSNLGFSDRFSERRFGNEGRTYGNANENRNQRFRETNPSSRTYGDANKNRNQRFRETSPSSGRYGDANENRNQRFRETSSSSGRYGDYGSPRQSSLSRNPGLRSNRFANSGQSQSGNYEDFERDHTTEKNALERRQDGFKQILDMLKEQK
ncbi:hypothetical protein GIB67_008202 [Kingdonia uniflora]|uniref:Uncharacterized protein n=1 Tax=Kingdonia uniflora TaxID=39325 RepID=A0A7J7M295_9MAGN|nr:hypothetical protein GIB67_017624 [Kingdonia uniflora]KAF6148989.1 hypothetical protein GIB67_008202 [Kingdonia uniflora]